jgi:hypothetical protein
VRPTLLIPRAAGSAASEADIEIDQDASAKSWNQRTVGVSVSLDAWTIGAADARTIRIPGKVISDVFFVGYDSLRVFVVSIPQREEFSVRPETQEEVAPEHRGGAADRTAGQLGGRSENNVRVDLVAQLPRR